MRQSHTYLILEAISDIECLGVGNGFTQGVHVVYDHLQGWRYFEVQGDSDELVFSDRAISVDLTSGHDLTIEVIQGQVSGRCVK